MFSVPLSVKLPCPGVTRRTALRSSDFPLASALRASAEQARTCFTEIRVRGPAVVWLTATLRLSQTLNSQFIWELAVWDLSVDFLFDAVLFELLVQIAARRVDDLGGLRDVPGVLSQLLHKISPFGCVLERAQCGGAGR